MREELDRIFCEFLSDIEARTKISLTRAYPQDPETWREIAEELELILDLKRKTCP